jgi:opacity protein-like surface antigen
MSKKLLAVIAIIASVSALTLGAQENTGNSSEVLRKKGDQSITILAGGFIPLFVLDSTGALISPSNMYPGASFDVQYRYMLGNHIGVGGSISGSFVTTIGGGTLFFAPIGATAAWIGGGDPLEYEFSTELGMNIMRLYGNGLIEPYAKLGAGLSRYVTSTWGIGAKVSWCFFPEFHFGTYSSLNSYANFLEFSIGASYHF